MRCNYRILKPDPTLQFSAFVVESARELAVDVLLNQTVFNLSADQAEAFAKALENPPAPTEKLKALMQSKAPWE